MGLNKILLINTFTIIKSPSIFGLCFYHSYFISGFLITLIARFYVKVIFFPIPIPTPCLSRWYLFPYFFFKNTLFASFSLILELFIYLVWR